MLLPDVLRNRDFGSFWFGTVLAEIGTRATVAANLYQIYDLTRSTAMVGLLGLAQAVALLVLSPMSGVIADRIDRRHLLQIVQGIILVVTIGLGIVTLAGVVTPVHILIASMLTMAATTFDRPARLALTGALVRRQNLSQAIALLNPSREIAVLAGPALAGLLIALRGAELVYLFASVAYAVLIVLLFLLTFRPAEPGPRIPFVRALREGIAYVRGRPIISWFMGLDVVLTLFGAYRVLLPAFALDILAVGPAGYGLLAASPSLGALIGAPIIYRLARRRASGRIVLGATMAFGLTCVAFAQAHVFVLAILVALVLGFLDALAATIRLSAVQLETPDALRGRVTSLYQLTARGGPALGDANIGWIAGFLGPVLALTLGGLVPFVVAGAVWGLSRTVRDYTSSDDEPEEPAPPRTP